MSGPVVVICAMDSEAVHLRKRLENVHEEPLKAWRRTRGTISRTPVDLVVSGIGLISAAAATTAECLDNQPVAVLNYGCAGAHRKDIDPGDVIIGDKVIHLGSYILSPDGQRHPFGFRVDNPDGRVHVDALPADPEMLETAQRIAQGMTLPIWPNLSHEPRIWVGALGSADVWTQHPNTINKLHRRHGSLCEEMEAAAVAQICATFGVPFLAIKDISNNELQSHTEVKSGDDGSALLADVKGEIGLRASLVIERLIRNLS